MLNLTASMALTMRHLADSSFRPRGDLVFVGVADEESGGEHGARFLCEQHHDAVATDYVITASGGMPLQSPTGTTRLPVLVAERGTLWTTLTVKGTAGHGSMPYGTDNAVVKAAEVVRRIADMRVPVRIIPEWRSFVGGFGLPDQVAEQLTSPDLDSVLSLLPPAIAKVAHSSTRTTITPTGLHCTSKTNVIPDTVQIRLDVRTLPGDGPDEVRALLEECFGDLADSVTVELGRDIAPTSSPVETPLWDSLQRVAQPFYPGAELLPMLSVGGTDNRFFRPAGAVGYGFGLYSDRTSLDELARMGHGDNERIDVRSLEMITDMWVALAHDFLC
jgi:acetylornithine deacetylase/succinyl-diaminopimelate desuccinylase-like protein